MVLSDQQRHGLHGRLEEVLGREHAAALMTQIPPTGWADMATKQDLVLLGERLDTRIDGVEAKIETSAAVGFIGAIGAYGGWMIPQTFGLSISLTGAPFRALELIMGLYLVCLAVLWTGFLRPERALAGGRLAEAEA